MKDLRIFVASSKELERERNELAFLVLAKEEEFASRGLRVRLAKWEYVDPRLTGARTEDRYLDEMYDCDAAFVLFRDIAGMYTREELDKALAGEWEGWSRLKAHRILFAADGAPDSDAAKLRAELPEGSYGVWSGMEELRAAFLELVDRVAGMELREAPSDRNVRKITAFLAADGELAEERNAFADTVLNVNELLEQAHRNIRVQLKFYDPANAESVIESSEMGLVLYGTNYRVFGRTELERIYARVKDGRGNPKRFYVFFRDLDEATEKSLDETFKAFRSDFVTKLGHFTCQFGDANALRLGFLLSLERYAGETVEIYSTVGTPTAPVFVGRENELRKLCSLLEPVPGRFPAGRLPVVTGAGGTGKSELVRQYASQLRVQYPGGVFQVDMEQVKSWDDVFLGLLNGVSNNGVRVRDYLGIEVEAEGPNPSEPITGAKVRDALLKKARETGAMLLFLDNVEGCLPLLGRAGGFEKAFPAGFSERVLVNVVATARVCDAVLRPADWGVEFPLGDLSRDNALALLLGERPNVDGGEREAAGRVAELLGYRALYLRAIPALLDNVYSPYAGSFACLEEALRESLLDTVGEGMDEAADGGRTPSALWEMTWNTLASQPGGGNWIRLAQIAAFCSPEGFPSHILRHLWGDLAAPEKKADRFFEQALLVLRKHGLLSGGDEVLAMHRLTRAAIQDDARGAWPDIEEQLGASLAKYPGMSRNDWRGFSGSLGIIRHIPPIMLDDELILFFLLHTPGYDTICPWALLDGWSWVRLLRDHPQYAEKCDWEKLGGWVWVELLCAQPQFADRCPWEELDAYACWPRQSWVRLLRAQPRFADKCPWEKLDGIEWTALLGNTDMVPFMGMNLGGHEQPQFADKCPWEKLDGGCWSALLGDQPQFADRCAWEKLEGRHWSLLLCAQPQFAERCPWEKLDGDDWAALLRSLPQFADKCDWEKVDGKNWSRLLESQPQFSESCPWNKLDRDDWTDLLCAQPKYADKCDWEKLKGENWSRLLKSQPQFADRCPWNKLDGDDWRDLLRAQPKFADKCDWGKLAGSNWYLLLESQPQFAERCPWNKLDGGDWRWLLCDQPQFADKCDWEKLSGGNWAALLREHPQFADKCGWGKLNGENWVEVLSSHPQFADMCDWEKLDGENWAALLHSQPQFARQCDLAKISGRNWAMLVKECPAFVDMCSWEQLDGKSWILLFSPLFRGRLGPLLPCRPQFADKCDWTKLNGQNWVELIRFHPQFADKCPWETLGGNDWTSLLCHRPQFAEHCTWSKLSDDDWKKLLEKQPQFAEKREGNGGGNEA